MKTREEILKLYQEHFGNNHEAGVFAVYGAGLADGRALRDELSAPKEKPASIKSDPFVTIGTLTATPPLVPGKFQPR